MFYTFIQFTILFCSISSVYPSCHPH